MEKIIKSIHGLLISVLTILIIVSFFGIIDWNIVIKYTKYLGYLIMGYAILPPPGASFQLVPFLQPRAMHAFF
ncbi:MAG: hypothetical protein WC069_06865 [Candidatus Shapirobacteria bacterium]